MSHSLKAEVLFKACHTPEFSQLLLVIKDTSSSPCSWNVISVGDPGRCSLPYSGYTAEAHWKAGNY